MKKNDQKGFMLVETLVVTTFIAGVFIFLFIQFSNLNKSYKFSFKYDTVEGKYALEDVLDYLKNETRFTSKIDLYMSSNEYIDITECSNDLFINVSYCKKLLSLENINKVIISNNGFKPQEESQLSENIKEYFNKINKKNENSFNYYVVIELKNGDVISKYTNF